MTPMAVAEMAMLGILLSGGSCMASAEMLPPTMQSARMHSSTPMTSVARFSFTVLRRWLVSSCQKRYVTAMADSTSTHESAPKPSSATLSASAPYTRPRVPSTMFHTMVAAEMASAAWRQVPRLSVVLVDVSAAEVVEQGEEAQLEAQLEVGEAAESVCDGQQVEDVVLLHGAGLVLQQIDCGLTALLHDAVVDVAHGFLLEQQPLSTPYSAVATSMQTVTAGDAAAEEEEHGEEQEEEEEDEDAQGGEAPVAAAPHLALPEHCF